MSRPFLSALFLVFLSLILARVNTARASAVESVQFLSARAVPFLIDEDLLEDLDDYYEIAFQSDRDDESVDTAICLNVATQVIANVSIGCAVIGSSGDYTACSTPCVDEIIIVDTIAYCETFGT